MNPVTVLIHGCKNLNKITCVCTIRHKGPTPRLFVVVLALAVIVEIDNKFIER